ncbi:unnamed protein product [Protopolystoma xenopodis]|uniref:Uncharacterized protein n=1 Tax=Protopolystoma xenopodis TaxID=117903 RepID=A0A448WK80_9PLAT|nr:unnamed protein product [Protopolystoma xenopodis]
MASFYAFFFIPPLLGASIQGPLIPPDEDLSSYRQHHLDRLLTARHRIEAGQLTALPSLSSYHLAKDSTMHVSPEADCHAYSRPIIRSDAQAPVLPDASCRMSFSGVNKPAGSSNKRALACHEYPVSFRPPSKVLYSSPDDPLRLTPSSSASKTINDPSSLFDSQPFSFGPNIGGHQGLSKFFLSFLPTALTLLFLDIIR